MTEVIEPVVQEQEEKKYSFGELLTEQHLLDTPYSPKDNKLIMNSKEIFEVLFNHLYYILQEYKDTPSASVSISAAINSLIESSMWMERIIKTYPIELGTDDPAPETSTEPE